MKALIAIVALAALIVIGGAAKLHRYDLCTMTVGHPDCMAQLLNLEE